MGHFTSLYCAFWGVPGCQFFSLADAVRLIMGSFALGCLALWAFGFMYRRR